MGFGDLKAKAGQQALNAYLADKSYIEGLVYIKEIKRFLCGENKQCNCQSDSVSRERQQPNRPVAEQVIRIIEPLF